MKSKEERIKSEISNLERRTKKGDVSSCFQLYQLYEKGKLEKNSQGEYEHVLEADATLAEKYLVKSDELLYQKKNDNGIECYENKLHLVHLILVDFRRFKSLKVKFDKQLTVFIGNNGSGKTSVADALAKPLSVISAGLIKQGRRGKSVTDFDVNIDSSTGAEVHTQIKLGDADYNSYFYKTVKGIEKTQGSKLKALDELSSLYRALNDKRIRDGEVEVNLPLFSFYSVNRTNTKSNRTFDIEKLSDIKPESRFSVYETAIDGTGIFGDFLEWFIILDNLAGDNLLLKLKSVEKRIKAFESVGVTEETHELWPLLTAAREEYSNIETEYNKKTTYIKHLEIVKKAITTIVPSFNDVFVDRSLGRAELKVDNDGTIINIFQASQGQQILISMVADIARRLVVLNPGLDNPLSGQGVIIIDEIELHLHPKWQQNIIKSLLETFPNVQFIVTTHSPQVLSTVDKSCIRQFVEDEDSNFKAFSPTFQTKGVRSADILARIMDTDSTPDVPEARQVDEFSRLLLDGNRDEAERILGNLIDHFGSPHPVIDDCLNQIKIFEMKLRAEQRKRVIDTE